MSERRYWIGVVSQEDADNAVAQGFVQFGFGRAEPLERMQPGDGVAFYSPRTTPQAGALVQAFTAIGRVGAAIVEGRVALGLKGSTIELTAGDWVYLDGGEAHSVKGIEDSSLLLTIIFSK